jgi:hypothetical protein
LRMLARVGQAGRLSIGKFDVDDVAAARNE